MLDETKRELAIGGSEIAAIFGMHDYLDEFGLWVRKKDPTVRDEPTPRMRLGKHLEVGIIEYYAELENLDVEWCDKTSRHPEHKFMAYTPDALVRGERRGADAKLVGWDQAHRWGHDAEHIPEHAVLQAHWYMIAMDYLRWDVVALVTGEDQPRIYPVERDMAMERVILKKAREWWERYLVGDERPPITGTYASSTWVKRKYPQPRTGVAEANAEESALLDQYAAVHSRFRSLEAEKNLLGNKLKQAIGEREGLSWSGGKFVWMKMRNTERVEWDVLANALLENNPAKEKLLAEFSVQVPGIRRVYFKPAKGEEIEL